MEYKFRVGDYFVTRQGDAGYIVELFKLNRNQTAFVLGFFDGKKQCLEYTHNGVYDEDDFYRFENYFKKIGSYDFSNIKIQPLKTATTTTILNKINEIIRHINSI